MSEHGGSRAAVALIGAVLAGVATWRTLVPRETPQPPLPALVVSVSGTAVHVRMSVGVAVGEDAPLKKGMGLGEDELIKVSGGECRIQLKDGSLVQLDSGDQSRSHVLITSLRPDGRDFGIDLREGRVAIAARPSLNWSVAVDSSASGDPNTARASGSGATALAQYRLGSHEFQLSVRRGTVSVKASVSATSGPTLREGEQIRVTGDFTEKPTPAPADPEMLELLDKLSAATAASPVASPFR